MVDSTATVFVDVAVVVIVEFSRVYLTGEDFDRLTLGELRMQTRCCPCRYGQGLVGAEGLSAATRMRFCN